MSTDTVKLRSPDLCSPNLAVDPEEMRAHADDAARLLKALSNSSRLMVLCSLAKGELTVGQINQRVPLSQSALSQHLAVLRRDGLVRTRRSAQTIYYSLADGPAGRVIDTLYEVFCGHSSA
jgi:ArsR family transcriptional regulator, virulence genes transcriptional regulator